MIVSVKRSQVRIPEEELDKDESLLDRYIRVLNGISYACDKYNEYSHGSRNTVAVDMTVACYMLGLDLDFIVTLFISSGLISESKEDDFDCIGERFEKIAPYWDRFSWDWMLNPEDYVEYSDCIDESNAVLFFELVED